MSFESDSLDQDSSLRSLSDEVSSSSSGDSSPTPSPNGILVPKPTNSGTESSSSLPIHSLNVKFAPLPALAPRKRRSTAPLGMAARSQLTRRGRRYHDPDGPYAWGSDEELDQHTKLRTMRDGQDDVMDDPFLAIGRAVKDASKQLWRKVSRSNLVKQTDTNVQSSHGEQDKLNKKDTLDESADTPSASSAPQDPWDGTVPSNSESPSNHEEHPEWQDDIKNGFPLEFGQTETIIEGRTKYLHDKPLPSVEQTVNDHP